MAGSPGGVHAFYAELKTKLAPALEPEHARIAELRGAPPPLPAPDSVFYQTMVEERDFAVDHEVRCGVVGRGLCVWWRSEERPVPR
jgi:hypothetical protein